MPELPEAVRARCVEAASRAIFDENGPECIDDDGAEALADVALAAVLPLLAEHYEAQEADVMRGLLYWNRRYVETARQLDAVRALVRDTDGDWLPPDSFSGLAGEIQAVIAAGGSGE